MIARLAVLCALAFAATAQNTEIPKPTPAAAEEIKAPELPPDLTAFQQAMKETEPEKKIAALEKWKAEFPESNMKDSADGNILNTLVTKLPSQEARIRQFAAAMYKSSPRKEKGSTAYGIADELLDGGILLHDAEGYARKGVNSMRLGAYVKEQLEGYEKRKQKAPSEAELRNRFLDSRAFRVAVLGRIEIKLGNTEKGKKLLEESFAGNANNGPVLSDLGELAMKSGNEQKAREYLLGAKLSGRASKEAAATFDALYRKDHNGLLDGMEAMLDAEYRKRFPNPVKVTPYQPGEKRSERVVLAEVFTGSGCGPCAGADVAFDAAMERYSRKDLAVLMYHLHVPRPDPMTNPDTQARAKSYNVRGVPTFAIDGKSGGGGGPRIYAPSLFEGVNKDIEKELETPAEAHFTVGAYSREKTVHVNVRVRGVPAESKDLKVLIALVEKDLRYNGENGIRFHPMVVRSIRSVDFAGEAYEETFDVNEVSKGLKVHLDDYEAKGHRGETFQFAEKKDRVDPNDLAVVVFLQQSKTKHVLQASYVDLSGPNPHPTFEANNGR